MLRGEVNAVQINSRNALRHVQIAMGQNLASATVLHHERLTLLRRIDVQRHINGGTFIDRQLRYQQIQGAWQQNGYGIASNHTLADQMMSQSIGLAVEFGVSQRLLAMNSGKGFRSLGHLQFKQRMDGAVPWIVRRAVVEAVQQLLALGLRQYGNGMKRSIRAVLQCIDQVFQGAQQCVAYPLRANLDHRKGGEGKAGAQVIHRQGQRIVGALFVAQAFNTVPGRNGLAGGHVHSAMAIVEQGVEQRRRR
ncbi:hypothetical protein PSCICJ_04280 [Pseudomonas cichorii]|nr:hypothetical protein PSCICJ_04280 [Pseudomonas cichorii]